MKKQHAQQAVTFLQTAIKDGYVPAELLADAKYLIDRYLDYLNKV